jgi:thioredoxin-like negative regulator of GroEL
LQFENSEYEEAIKSLLEIIQIDRNWNNKAANDLLKQIFSYLGSDNELTIQGRKKLAKILF